MAYTPLEFLKEGMDQLPNEFKHRPGHIWEDYCSIVLPGICGMSEERMKTLEEKEFLEYVLRRSFLIKGHNAKNEHAEWDKNIYRYIPMLNEVLGYKETASLEYEISDLRDVLVMNIIQDKWVRNKQVLKPDPVFIKYLCDTESLQVTNDTFKNLPFNTFYIDLENCNDDKKFGDVLGLFIDIMFIESDNETAVTLYILRPGNIVVSSYLNFDMNKCPNEIDTSYITDSERIATVPAAMKEKETPADTVINTRLITILILQLISYMKVAKPDIEPSPEMKSTYRPGTTIKNKYSEIYKQDVGVRIGATITRKIKEMNKAKEEQEREAALKGRKPPIPHFRKAHWHRYWTGKGRTVCEFRWIEPVFVCGSYSSDSVTDVVIHNVYE